MRPLRWLRGARVVVSRRRRRLLLAALVLYAWWVAGLTGFTWPARVAVAVPIVIVLVLAVRSTGDRQPVGGWLADRRQSWRAAWWGHASPSRSRARTGIAWTGLLAALGGVQLYAYFSGWGRPRSERPTLSWLLGHVEVTWGVAVLVLVWLALGLYLARR